MVCTFRNRLVCAPARFQRAHRLPDRRDRFTSGPTPSRPPQSILPLRVRATTLSLVMTYTIAPQPERASRSTPLRRHWETVSKSSSGFMSGRYMDSHMPQRESGAVPAHMMSGDVSMAPRESMPVRKGFPSSPRPAITALMHGGGQPQWHQWSRLEYERSRERDGVGRPTDMLGSRIGAPGSQKYGPNRFE